MSKIPFIQQFMVIFLGCAWLADSVSAGACSIDHNRLDHGEKSSFMICGKNIPQNFTLEGFDEAGITIDYVQWIRKCAPDRKERGLYLWLSTEDEAVTANVGVRDPETGEQVCSGLTIDIPSAARLGKATLSPIRHPDGNTYRLDIESGDAGSLVNACVGGLEFPRSTRWPAVRLLNQQEVATISMDSGKFGPSQWYSLPQSTARRKQGPADAADVR